LNEPAVPALPAAGFHLREGVIKQLAQGRKLSFHELGAAALGTSSASCPQQSNRMSDRGKGIVLRSLLEKT